MGKLCGLYIIERPATGDLYVGQSVDIKKRWSVHRGDLRAGRHGSRFLQRVYNKHGLSAFEFKIVEVGFDPLDRAALNAAEQKMLDELKPAFNTLPVAGSRAGVKASAETRAKMSAAHMGNKVNLGRPSAFKGRRHSPETIARISQAKKGQPGPRKGIPRTDEVKRKISETKRARHQELRA